MIVEPSARRFSEGVAHMAKANDADTDFGGWSDGGFHAVADGTATPAAGSWLQTAHCIGGVRNRFAYGRTGVSAVVIRAEKRSRIAALTAGMPLIPCIISISPCCEWRIACAMILRRMSPRLCISSSAIST